ncbi:HIRAN domain-containing protein [Arthrobacter sp. Z1-15]
MLEIAGTNQLKSTVAENSLLVTWQNPETRAWFLMGHLRESDGRYTFAYYPGVEENSDFRPVPGFADVSKTYESRVLFPLFSSRLMSGKRADRPEWLESLGLRSDANAFEILGRSLGRRVADTVELYPEPIVDFAARTVTAEVPIHGLRYHPDGLDLLDRGALQIDDRLVVVPEPDNRYDDRALAIFTPGGVKLGYVPAPILEYLARSGLSSHNATATAVHVNPRQYGHHQRLILNVVWSL